MVEKKKMERWVKTPLHSFDTAENEPAKNLQDFANFPTFARSRAPAAHGGVRTAMSRETERKSKSTAYSSTAGRGTVTSLAHLS